MQDTTTATTIQAIDLFPGDIIDHDSAAYIVHRVRYAGPGRVTLRIQTHGQNVRTVTVDAAERFAIRGI